MPQAFNAIGNILSDIAKPVESVIGDIAKGVGDIATGNIGGLGSDLVQGFSQAFQGFGNVLGDVGNLLGGGGGNGLSSSPMPFSGVGGNFGGGYGGGFGGAPGGDLSQIGSSLDNMQNQATQLMQSSNPSDQLKGQQMMQQEQMIFQAISKAIQLQGEDTKTAIQAIQ